MAEAIEFLAQFGVAGLMGALWIWERNMSRQRERELTEAHRKIVTASQELTVVASLVQQNTAAIERFNATQNRLDQLLEQLVSAHTATQGGQNRWRGQNS